MKPLEAASNTLTPLPDVLSHGLAAVSAFGLLSFCCSTSLFCYLSWRLIRWRFKAGPHPPINQFFLLIFNLLWADIQQACAFLLNINTLRNNAILVGSKACFVQGWFVSTGDLASSVFICGIAVHTFFSVVRDYQLPNCIFYCCIGAAWAFVYVMGLLGPVIHGRYFFVRASAWCWISNEYAIERLWLHYFWIFACMFLTILLYMYIFLHLRHCSRALLLNNKPDQPDSVSHIYGATPLMLLYPSIYTICTLPLAAGRLASLGGHNPSLAFFCVAGSMIACNGWLDVLLYASTRSDIVFSDDLPNQETGLETFAFMGKAGRRARLGTVTTIEGGRDVDVRLGYGASDGSRKVGRGAGRRGSTGSREHLYELERLDIAVKGEVTVSVDVLDYRLERPGRILGSGVRSLHERSASGKSSMDGD